MQKLLIGLIATLVMSGCKVPESSETTKELSATSEKVKLSKKERSAIAWEENVAGKPIVLRRTTLIVRDIEKSLSFYRDVLGMKVQYDQNLTSPNLETRYGNDGINRSRLVFLEAQNEFIGVLGLWQFLDQTEKDLKEPSVPELIPGQLVFVFNTTTLEETFEKAKAIPGVKVLETPTKSVYPSEAGEIITLVSMFTDPDGHAVELNQVLFDPRRQ